MRILPSTRTLLRKLAVATHKYELLVLFSYYEDNGSEGPTQETIFRDTGIPKKTIKAATDAMVGLGFLKRIVKSRNQRYIYTSNIASLDVDESSVYIIDIYSSMYTTKGDHRDRKIDSNGYVQTEKSTSDRSSGANVPSEGPFEVNGSSGGHLKGRWTVKDIMVDPDWKVIHEILLKYFRPYQINPAYLTKKNYFSRLINLLEQVDNFDSYCSWYRTNKYPLKKFTYGLFLYPGMLEEYKESLEDDIYLKGPTIMENSEKYRKTLEDQEQTLIDEFGDANA